MILNHLKFHFIRHDSYKQASLKRTIKKEYEINKSSKQMSAERAIDKKE